MTKSDGRGGADSMSRRGFCFGAQTRLWVLSWVLQVDRVAKTVRAQSLYQIPRLVTILVLEELILATRSLGFDPFPGLRFQAKVRLDFAVA